MARISLTPPRSLRVRLATAYSKRQFGTTIDPLLAEGHHPQLLMTNARFETGLSRWKALDPQLKTFAEMAAAHRIGCSWCTDFGYWTAHGKGIDPQKLRDVPRWRESDRFTELERQVIEYADTMSGDVHEVRDELVEALRSSLGEKALVELTMMIAVENLRSRFNSALGLTSQGFAEQCEVPV